jgi:hypothetical protein
MQLLARIWSFYTSFSNFTQGAHILTDRVLSHYFVFFVCMSCWVALLSIKKLVPFFWGNLEIKQPPISKFSKFSE